MTALRPLDDFRMLAVAAPAYVARHPAPAQPRDLHHHNCIRYRLPWDGPIQPWIFNKGRQDFEIAVEGSLVVNDPELLLSATLDGVGIAYLAQPLVAPLQHAAWNFPVLSEPPADADATAGLSQFRSSAHGASAQGSCRGRNETGRGSADRTVLSS